MMVIFLQILIDMDRKDEQSGMMEELHQQLHSAYCQFTVTSHELCRSECFSHLGDRESSPDPKNVKSGLIHPTLGRLSLPGIKVLIV